MLLSPKDLGWADESIKEFTNALLEKAPKKKWTSLLLNFMRLGVALPSACRCEQEWEKASSLHANHADFNTKIRAAIIMVGAREGLHKALYRDINGPDGCDETYGRVALRSYGRELLDFLRAEPTKEWFKAPVPSFRLYQGGALDHQERNPGLSN